MAEHPEENELIKQKKAKLDSITKSGVYAYGEKFGLSSSIKGLKDDFAEGKTVSLAEVGPVLAIIDVPALAQRDLAQLGRERCTAPLVAQRPDEPHVARVAVNEGIRPRLGEGRLDPPRRLEAGPLPGRKLLAPRAGWPGGP